MLQFVPITAVAPAAIEVLLDRAFGRARHGKTAYRLREGVEASGHLSFAAIENGELIGTIQCWPVEIAGDDSQIVPMVMVGPVAVDPDRQRAGLGKQLMRRALDAAQASGEDRAMMLVGDPEYYERFFGFTAERTARWRLPGPVEPRRLLARGPDVPAMGGLLRPRLTVAA